MMVRRLVCISLARYIPKRATKLTRDAKVVDRVPHLHFGWHASFLEFLSVMEKTLTRLLVAHSSANLPPTVVVHIVQPLLPHNCLISLVFIADLGTKFIHWDDDVFHWSIFMMVDNLLQSCPSRPLHCRDVALDYVHVDPFVMFSESSFHDPWFVCITPDKRSLCRH